MRSTATDASRPLSAPCKTLRLQALVGPQVHRRAPSRWRLPELGRSRDGAWGGAGRQPECLLSVRISRAGRPNGQGRAGTKASGGHEVRRLGGPWAQLRGGHGAVAAVPAQRARAARPAVSLEARARAVRGHARPHPATGGRRIVRARALRRHRGRRDPGHRCRQCRVLSELPFSSRLHTAISREGLSCSSYEI